VDASLRNSSQNQPEVLSAATDVYLFSQKLVVSSPSPVGQDKFGTSVGISGDRAVVGAPEFDSNKGAVYLYKRVGNDWQQVQRITGENAGDRFGESVGISGTTIVVGAIHYGSNDKGAAYVYTESCSPTCTWTQQGSRLEDTADYAGDDLASDYFGKSVAIDGDRIIVGAYFDSTSASHFFVSGSATIFSRSGTTWSVAEKLAGPGAGSATPTQFGWSVDIAGDQAIVGGNNYSPSSPTELGFGLAFIFELSAGDWIKTKEFVGSASNSALGHSVAIDSDTAVVGAPGNVQTAYTSSKTCSGGSWCSLAALSPSGGNEIGTSVDIDGDMIVVGVHITNARGEVLVFRKISGTWTHKGTMATAQTTSLDFLGSDVGVDGNRIIAGANVDNGSASLFSVTPPVRFDYDGRFSASTPRFDNYGICGAEVGVFRPSNDTWYFDQPYCGPPLASPTPTPQLFSTPWGTTGDKLAPADFNGDGRMDIAVFRPSDSTYDWYIRDSATGSTIYKDFGSVGDIPMPADYDADGSADATVFRPSNGTWYVLKSSGGTITQQWGQSADIPIQGDINGDGYSELVVFRPSDGTFYWYDVVASQYGGVQWGTSGDIPVGGDFDGDLKSDFAVFRPSNSTWYIRNSSDLSTTQTQFGQCEDIPAPADYDSDGETDIAVFRPGNGTWYTVASRSGDIRYTYFGTSGDIPVAAAFQRNDLLCEE